MTEPAKSVPPTAMLDLAKARMVIPASLLVAVLGAAVGVGATVQKIPSEEKVLEIATRATSSGVKEAFASELPRQLAPLKAEVALNTQAKIEQNQINAAFAKSVTRLEAFSEMQTIQAISPNATSPNATKLRQNLKAGRDPLDGIVPEP